MTTLKRLGLVIATWTMIAGAAEFGGQLNIPAIPDFVSPAGAVVGRPLTPVSVAGVARRTTRRCAAGVYNC
jgi:hypothetical protein